MKLHITKSDSLSPYPLFPQSLRPLPWACVGKQVYICLVNTMPCPTLVAECSQCESNSQIHATDCILQGSKQVEILRVTDQDCRRDGVTLSSQILLFVPKFSNLYVALHCHFEARFLWNPSWALLESRCQCQSLLSLLLALYLLESHLNSPRKQWGWPCPLTETFWIFFLGGGGGIKKKK
jgi:hypothetical protein